MPEVLHRKEIREILSRDNNKIINLSNYSQDIFHTIKVKDGDFYNPKSNYRKILGRIINNQHNKDENGRDDHTE